MTNQLEKTTNGSIEHFYTGSRKKHTKKDSQGDRNIY